MRLGRKEMNYFPIVKSEIKSCSKKNNLTIIFHYAYPYWHSFLYIYSTEVFTATNISNQYFVLNWISFSQIKAQKTKQSNLLHSTNSWFAFTKPEGSLKMHTKIIRLDLGMSHHDLFHVFTLYSSYIHSNIVIPSTPTSQTVPFLQCSNTFCTITVHVSPMCVLHAQAVSFFLI
jgi:hypothetical protein